MRQLVLPGIVFLHERGVCGLDHASVLFCVKEDVEEPGVGEGNVEAFWLVGSEAFVGGAVVCLREGLAAATSRRVERVEAAREMGVERVVSEALSEPGDRGGCLSEGTAPFAMAAELLAQGLEEEHLKLKSVQVDHASQLS